MCFICGRFLFRCIGGCGVEFVVLGFIRGGDGVAEGSFILLFRVTYRVLFFTGVGIFGVRIFILILCIVCKFGKKRRVELWIERRG